MDVLISEYSSGFAHYTHCLCDELAKYSGIDVTYLSDKNNQYFNKMSSNVRKIALYDVFTNDKKYKKGSVKWALNRIITTVNNCFRRNKYVKKFKPEITIVQLTLTSIDRFFLRRIKPYTKLVFTVHDVIVPSKSLSWNMKALKKVYGVADKLVAHTHANMEQLIDDFGISKERIEVIPLGIDMTYKRLDKKFCREKLGIRLEENVFLFYGGIRETKGLDVLLNAMKGVDAKLIIAGAIPYGETFDKYRELIEVNGIQTIEFLTFTDDSFRDILFQASDYLILPYKEFSSQSGVLMQSIKYKLPVIASDVGSFKEYIKLYQIGFCFKANSIQELRKTLNEAIDSNMDFEDNMLKVMNENSWEYSGKLYKELLIKTFN